MYFIDTHSHMYLPQFDSDIQDCIQRCKEKSVKKVILPNIDSETIMPLKELALKEPTLFYPIMGLHPTHVKENFEEELNKIFNELDKTQYCGIGEIGIDLYWDKTFFENQQIAFEKQVRYAIDKDLPFVIHARDSFQEIIDVLEKINQGSYKGIFHAFSGEPKQAEKVIEMGFLIGIGGVSTFKNSNLPEVIGHIDLNHIVLETDSPYLAPVPYRGKRNESSYIPLIAENISAIKGINVEKVAQVTTSNTENLFNI